MSLTRALDDDYRSKLCAIELEYDFKDAKQSSADSCDFHLVSAIHDNIDKV